MSLSCYHRRCTSCVWIQISPVSTFGMCSIIYLCTPCENHSIWTNLVFFAKLKGMHASKLFAIDFILLMNQKAKYIKLSHLKRTCSLIIHSHVVSVRTKGHLGPKYWHRVLGCIILRYTHQAMIPISSYTMLLYPFQEVFKCLSLKCNEL